MVDAQRLTRVFKALSAAARVKIVLLLKDRVLCVNALAAQVEVSPAAISQHLRILRDADLVVTEKRGNHVPYRINRETLRRWGRLADDFLSMEIPGPGHEPGCRERRQDERGGDR